MARGYNGPWPRAGRRNGEKLASKAEPAQEQRDETRLSIQVLAALGLAVLVAAALRFRGLGRTSL